MRCSEAMLQCYTDSVCDVSRRAPGRALAVAGRPMGAVGDCRSGPHADNVTFYEAIANNDLNRGRI